MFGNKKPTENVTQMSKHSNVRTFVHALIAVWVILLFLPMTVLHMCAC